MRIVLGVAVIGVVAAVALVGADAGAVPPPKAKAEHGGPATSTKKPAAPKPAPKPVKPAAHAKPAPKPHAAKPAHPTKATHAHPAPKPKKASKRKHRGHAPAGHLGVRRGPGRAHVRFDGDWASHPSAKYAALDPASCKAELTQRGIGFTEVAHAPGVLAPVRLKGDVGGVVYRTELPDHVRKTSPFEVFDCRLVLALSDFSRILRAHDIDEVRIFSAWRPPAKSWPDDRLGKRHPGALAIDARRFGKHEDGATETTWLVVEDDFHGSLGAPPCGPDAAPPTVDTKEARELRSIVCAAADEHVFTSILTPDYNRAHFNHFHLEVTPDVSWSLVR
jgi:hypothetical protein